VVSRQHVGASRDKSATARQVAEVHGQDDPCGRVGSWCTASVARESIVFGTDNDCGVLLMPSTLSAYPQVIWRRLASFRVVKFNVSAAHSRLWSEFDSRQLH